MIVYSLPQDAYGLEELATEEICKHYNKDFGIECRIGRFHNIYGPFGTWKDGICHVYVDKSANIDMAKQIIRDAKTDYPVACNAMETLLVHKSLSSNGRLNELILELQREGVQMYGGPKATAMLNIVETSSFHHKYSSLTCTIEIVEDVFAAIDHINKHGRHVRVLEIILIFVIIITNFIKGICCFI
uniref:Delta-1-pyrroline-5-carboxylate synthase-like n=1 Tax=Cicer arietinum TaxID=3827 RepID=A0A3Q7WZ63_CICAR|nr:delta-1-pyrroline-5-carboxylate synthase-like [Cicer arietinum]